MYGSIFMRMNPWCSKGAVHQSTQQVMYSVLSDQRTCDTQLKTILMALYYRHQIVVLKVSVLAGVNCIQHECNAMYWFDLGFWKAQWRAFVEQKPCLQGENVFVTPKRVLGAWMKESFNQDWSLFQGFPGLPGRCGPRRPFFGLSVWKVQ